MPEDRTDPAAPVDLEAAARAVDCADAVVRSAIAQLAVTGIDDNQVLAYDLAHAAAGAAAGRAVLGYGAKGELEGRIACAFVADVVADFLARLAGREGIWGVEPGPFDAVADFVAAHRHPASMAALCGLEGPRHLDEEFEMARQTFRRFAENEIRPIAEHVHRANGDIPESIIERMADLGGFGLSVPEEYGGSAVGGESDYMAMVVATEELSWGSIGVGGSLITRPEILTRAVLNGGTEEQKKEWLPKVASGELLSAVAVTEPDFGSDVAGVVVAATKTEGGWLVNGTKTWSTWAARANALMLLVRTDPDRSKGHRGLSLFVSPKEPATGKGFKLVQPVAPGGTTGTLEGRPIDTIGYRGMHSYELAFDNWFIADDHLIGGEAGVGRGFYLQMAGFENGRLQTVGRAVGIMQAAYDAAYAYAGDRLVFGSPVLDYQLTRVKLARMSVIIQASRQLAYEVARQMGQGEGTLGASMAKAYVCRMSEWVTREAMQIHGGMGYAEEFAVSRWFLDARVLSIFEGADETLSLKVIARRLMESAA